MGGRPKFPSQVCLRVGLQNPHLPEANCFRVPSYRVPCFAWHQATVTSTVAEQLLHCRSQEYLAPGWTLRHRLAKQLRSLTTCTSPASRAFPDHRALVFQPRQQLGVQSAAYHSSGVISMGLISWFEGAMWLGVSAISVAAVALFVWQDKLLYFPQMPVRDPDQNPEGIRSPTDLDLPYENIYLTTKDGVRIHGWLIRQHDSDQVPTILYFHGNAGNIGYRLQNAKDMYQKLRCNIFMVEYRGYGKSEGTPTEAGLLLDGEAAVAAVSSGELKRLDPSKMVVFGRSLGGAVAIALAEAHPDQVSAVIVENTFLSIGAMVDVLMPFLRLLKPLVLRIKWDNHQRIRSVRQPVLFVSGDRDELVPPSHMQTLYQRASRSRHRRMHVVRGGMHNDTWYRGGETYYQALMTFLDEVMYGNLPSRGQAREDTQQCNDASQDGLAGGGIPRMPKVGTGPAGKKADELRKKDT